MGIDAQRLAVRPLKLIIMPSPASRHGCARRRTFVVVPATIVSVLLSTVPRASAQNIEVIGTRALGMAGAFVAVADDASAIYWNPAGIATGPLFDFVIERQGANTFFDGPDRTLDTATRAIRESSALIAIGTPPLGVGYYRVRTTILPGGPAALPAGNRQPVRSGETALRTLVTHHFGVTLVQSVAQGVTLGTSLKIVRGTAGQRQVTANIADEALDAGRDVPGASRTTFDLDVGALASLGAWRVGLVGRNLRQPAFPVRAPDGMTAAPVRLARQIRAGIAFAPRSRPEGTNGPLSVAADVDLQAAETVVGRRRELAVGGEKWWFGGRAAARGGFRVNTLTNDGLGREPVASGGFSLSPKSGVLVEGQVTRGRRGVGRGWGVTARVTF